MPTQGYLAPIMEKLKRKSGRATAVRQRRRPGPRRGEGAKMAKEAVERYERELRKIN